MMPMQMKKTLYLLRHAKAETGSASQDDHDRAINQQGIDACSVMGPYLINNGFIPQLVLCSTATRVQQTWGLIKKSYKSPILEEHIDGLYLATANEILKHLANVADTVASVMVV